MQLGHGIFLIFFFSLPPGYQMILDAALDEPRIDWTACIPRYMRWGEGINRKSATLLFMAGYHLLARLLPNPQSLGYVVREHRFGR
jgi:hypothetical protein